MKKIFIAATKQNDGKTSVSLGLIANFKDRFKDVGFIKPIGQRYLEEEGVKIDEDSILIEEVCQIKAGLKDMSPVAVEKGFTEKYITHPDKKSISQKIRESFKRVAKRKGLVVIEGTGHAGVGSVFDHSNAYVAKLLGSKVILISSGGIGRPIDEIILNKALFDREGVKLLGVIINKVMPEKFNKINRLVRLGLARKKIDVLGVLPYDPMLAAAAMAQIQEETGFQVLMGEKGLTNRVENIIVGAMQPHDALKFLKNNSLVITPGDREDVILALISSHLSCVRQADRPMISGIILTGGLIPDKNIMDTISQTNVPVLKALADTYTVASQIHDLIVKIRPQDKEKINTIVGLIKKNVDLDRILKGI